MFWPCFSLQEKCLTPRAVKHTLTVCPLHSERRQENKKKRSCDSEENRSSSSHSNLKFMLRAADTNISFLILNKARRSSQLVINLFSFAGRATTSSSHSRCLFFRSVVIQFTHNSLRALTRLSDGKMEKHSSRRATRSGFN